MSGPMTALGAACPMIRRAVKRKGIDDVLGEHDHLARMGTRMNNIFWIIGVIVVVIAVLGFFGLR